MRLIGIPKFERDFIPKRETEKLMLPQVVTRFLDSCLSYVFMTDVFCNWSLT